MDVNLKGVHRVRRRLADGSYRVHYYAWRGGPRLDGEPGSPEFIASYHEAHRKRAEPVADLPQTVNEAVTRFLRSGEYTKLSDATRRDYRGFLDMIRAEFGDAPLAAFQNPQMRGDIKAWRDTMRDTPRKADYAVAVLKRLLSWCMDNGEISVNPAAKLGRLHKSDRSAEVWTEADFAKLEAHAHPRIVWLARFAGLTGFRRSDLCAVTYAHDKGAYFDLTTRKSNARVIVPILPECRALLDAMPESSGPIIRGVKGEPLTPAGISANIGKAKRRAAIKKRLHDLRGTAVTRLALAGLDDREIAAIVGWTTEQVAQVRRYYVNAESVALNAARRLSVNAPGKRQDPEEG